MAGVGLLVGFAAWTADRTRAQEPPPASDRKVDFLRHVQPILQTHCRRCHGPEKQRQRPAAGPEGRGTQGGRQRPGDPGRHGLDQPILKRVSDPSPETRMPPEGPPLTAEQIALLRAWIDQGAAWLDDGSSAAISTDWWSLRPLVAPAIAGPPQNAIDGFVRAKLKDETETTQRQYGLDRPASADFAPPLPAGAATDRARRALRASLERRRRRRATTGTITPSIIKELPPMAPRPISRSPRCWAI